MKDNVKTLVKHTGFKFYEAMNTIKLGNSKISTMFYNVWLKYEKEFSNEPNYALATKGTYYPKEMGCCHNWLSKKKKG